MNFEYLIDIKDVILQELDICIELLEKENFDTLNIIANRIMENCLFSKDHLIFLPGLFIKEITLVFSKIFSSKEAKAFHSSKIIGKDYINSLKEKFKSEINEELIWTEYHLFLVKILQYFRYEYENKLYTDNIEFSKSVAKSIINYLCKNEEVLYLKYNQFFSGIVNVLDRVFRVHSGTVEVTMIITYLKMFDRLYDYLILKYFEEESIDKEKLKEEINPYLKYLYKIGNFEELDFKEYNQNLWEIVKKWREYYIKYRNSVATIYQQIPQQKIIKLPEETKKIIEESLKESIEKKL